MRLFQAIRTLSIVFFQDLQESAIWLTRVQVDRETISSLLELDLKDDELYNLSHRIWGKIVDGNELHS